ncbi:hypothetical protein [Rhizobium grahamii]|uniref:hypothetical protein n=1 Tax=Rhizobium grahamii TaxID=1120045 RepID=UPI0016774ED3|nr:hypothetical protein [Rhizobium grahamii]
MTKEGQKLAVRLVGWEWETPFRSNFQDRLIAACLEPGASVSKLAREPRLGMDTETYPAPCVAAVFDIVFYSGANHCGQRRV